MFLDEYLSTHPKKHLIFDLDATILTLLVDWASWRNGLWEMVQSIDRSLPQKFPEKTGATAAQLYNVAVKKHGQTARAALLKYCQDFELKHLKGTTINQAIAQGIKTYASNYTLYVWSSNNHLTVKFALQKHGLHQYFTKS